MNVLYLIALIVIIIILKYNNTEKIKNLMNGFIKFLGTIINFLKNIVSYTKNEAIKTKWINTENLERNLET